MFEEEAKEALVVEFAEKESAIIESVDRYLDKAIEEFVAEAKEALDASVKSEKAEMRGNKKQNLKTSACGYQVIKTF